jgi:hypothetical protein
MIAGVGEWKTLRLMTRYADFCNFFDNSTDAVAHKQQVVLRDCAHVGHDDREIDGTMTYVDSALDKTEAFLVNAKKQAILGISEFQVLSDRNPIHSTEPAAEHIALRVPAMASPESRLTCE